MIYSFAGVPGLTAHFINETAVNVSWNAPSGNEKVASYEVIILEGNAELNNITVDNSTRSVIIPSLDYCKSYTVQVVGILKNGSVITTPAPGNVTTYQYNTRCGKNKFTFYSFLGEGNEITWFYFRASGEEISRR